MKCRFVILSHHTAHVTHLNLVHIVALDDSVKHRVQVIQKVDNLQRCAVGRQLSKPNDIAEVYRDLYTLHKL